VSIRPYIRTIPNYPKEGVQFRDITSLLANPQGLREAVDVLALRYKGSNIKTIAAIEARGFIVGAPLAYLLGCGFVPIRKKGKLPGKTRGMDYVLEYGSDRIEIHEDAIESGDRVLLVDDLIATGGTAKAAVELLLESGAILHEIAFLVDLPDLGGSRKLREKGYSIFSLCEFGGD
jgi:adenine phosphoribosyltransferase